MGRSRGVKTLASKVCRRGRSRCAEAGDPHPPGPRPDLAFVLEECNVNAAAILDPCPPSVAPPR